MYISYVYRSQKSIEMSHTYTHMYMYHKLDLAVHSIASRYLKHASHIIVRYLKPMYKKGAHIYMYVHDIVHVRDLTHMYSDLQ